MNKLEQARTQIDAIDREMAKLYEARLDAVKDVIAYKIENDLPILDSGREQVVIEKNLQVMDMTASILARDNKMPMWVFGLNEENSIVNTMKGEFSGTKVTV